MSPGQKTNAMTAQRIMENGQRTDKGKEAHLPAVNSA